MTDSNRSMNEVPGLVAERPQHQHRPFVADLAEELADDAATGVGD